MELIRYPRYSCRNDFTVLAMNHSQFVYIKMDRGWCTSATRNIALIIIVMIKASFGPARVCSWGWACAHASWLRPFSTGTEALSCIDRWPESVVVLWCMLRRLGVGKIILHEGRPILGKIYSNLTSIYFPCLHTFSFHWFGPRWCWCRAEIEYSYFFGTESYCRE